MKSGINVVFGENESGKSTLLTFISSMFYGINKNKNGKEISNLDKYTPWSEGEFSGKISYELDNREEFEVYRNFTKKNPQVFDKFANDISKNFEIDKTYGNRFFYEQTKVDEELFNMSMIIPQQEVKLDSKSQNILIQKASNIMLTGEDSVSYQKVLRKLEKKQTDEIGTLKSPTKPLYIAKQNVANLSREKENLESLLPLKYQIDEQIKKKEIEIKDEEMVFKVLQELEKIDNLRKLEEEKIKIHINAKEELEKEKEEVLKQEKAIPDVAEKSKSSGVLYLLPVALLIAAVVLFVFSTLPVSIASASLSVISFIFILLKNMKTNREFREARDEVRIKKREFEEKVQKLDTEINAKENMIKNNQNELETRINLEKEKIFIMHPKARSIGLQDLEGKSNIFEEQNYINELKLSLSQDKLRKDEVIKSLEELVQIEEKLSLNQEILDELIAYDEEIEIAKEALGNAYLKMKESITPKFTENLSNSIKSITSGKYRKVKVNEENGLSLETENRKLCYGK